MVSIVFLHEAVREYVYPAARNRLVLKIKCEKESCLKWEVIYWNRYYEDSKNRAALKHMTRDKDFDCFVCEISEEQPLKYLRYCFAASNDDGTIYFGPYGQSASVPERCFEYLYTNDCDVLQVPKWAKGAVAYQIFPERFSNGDTSNDPEQARLWDGRPTRENFFGGDLKGITDKLDYLALLGIDMLYLNPIFASPSNHKYDTADYYRIDPSLGTIGDLKKLTGECHKRGMHVILDGVFNHCGYLFAPFQDVLRNGDASKYKDWFYIDAFPVRTDPPNYECVGYYKWMPKIRLKCREARDYFLGVGTFWINEADIDGWRLDVADEADFTFWQEFRRAVKAVKEDALLLAETWKDGRDLLRGDEMDSVMNYLFRDAAVDFFARHSISAEEFDNRIQRMISIYAPAAHPALYNLIGSHDTERFLTQCEGDKRRLRLAAGMQMTFPGMPAIYYGDEIGMDGGNDPDCRKAMDWEAPDAEMLGFYKKLIALRKSERCLKEGDFCAVYCGEDCYAFARRAGGESVYVSINNSSEAKQLNVPIFEGTDCSLKSLMDGNAYEPAEYSGRGFNRDVNDYRSEFRLVLPAYRLDVIKAWRN